MQNNYRQCVQLVHTLVSFFHQLLKFFWLFHIPNITFRVEYNTFDILQDEEVRWPYQQLCILLNLNFKGSAGAEKVLQLANLSTVICQRGAHWWFGYC